MKKLTLLVLALALFIPLNSYAFTTFVALDQAVADDGLTGMEFDISGVETFLNPPTVSGPFTFLDVDSVTHNYNIVPAYLAITDGFPTLPIAGSFNEAGILFYYTNTSMVDPILNQTVPGGAYDLTKTFDFVSYTGGILPTDSGSLYTISQVPLPSAIFLLAPGLLALFGLRRKIAS